MAKIIRVLFKTIFLISLLPTVYFLATYRDLTGIFVDAEKYRSETKLIAVHHDGIERKVSIKEIQDYHKDSCGWESGFGYNFYLKNGKIYQVHELNACTAHAIGFNCNAVSICLHTSDKHDFRTQLNLILLINFLKLKFDIEKQNIVGHRDLPGNDTKCPDLDMNKVRTWIIGK